MRKKQTQTGPAGSSNEWPLPSILGDAEYDLTIFSWSIVIGPPAKGENAILVITSCAYHIFIRSNPSQVNRVYCTSRSIHHIPIHLANIPQTLHPVIPPLAITVGSSPGEGSPEAEYGGTRIQANVRIAD
jgi:hypothetical protein